MVGEPLSDPAVDAETLQEVDSYHTLAKVNATPYVSDIGPFDVNCYVHGDVADYRKIHPEANGSHATVAPGTVIVREVLDASGTTTKLTVMAKGPAGYDPSIGDWLFGVTDPQGKPLEKNGIVQLGRLTECHSCHLERAQDDFLFGVSLAVSN